MILEISSASVAQRFSTANVKLTGVPTGVPNAAAAAPENSVVPFCFTLISRFVNTPSEAVISSKPTLQPETLFVKIKRIYRLEDDGETECKS